MTGDVTDSGKRDTRYPRVFVCAACRLLAESHRSHATTCSNACRQALHRHPEIAADLHKLAGMVAVKLPSILDAMAVKELLPDLLPRIIDGELDPDEYRPMLHDALMTRVFAVLEEG